MKENDTQIPQPPRPESRVRDHLANERTFLAWVRTALGLIGIGFVLARMGVFLRQLSMVSESAPRHEFRGSHEFLITGVVFLVLGIVICISSGWAYHLSRKAIDEGRYEPPSSPGDGTDGRRSGQPGYHRPRSLAAYQSGRDLR